MSDSVSSKFWVRCSGTVYIKQTLKITEHRYLNIAKLLLTVHTKECAKEMMKDHWGQNAPYYLYWWCPWCDVIPGKFACLEILLEGWKEYLSWMIFFMFCVRLNDEPQKKKSTSAGIKKPSNNHLDQLKMRDHRGKKSRFLIGGYCGGTFFFPLWLLEILCLNHAAGFRFL